MNKFVLAATRKAVAVAIVVSDFLARNACKIGEAAKWVHKIALEASARLSEKRIEKAHAAWQLASEMETRLYYASNQTRTAEHMLQTAIVEELRSL